MFFFSLHFVGSSKKKNYIKFIIIREIYLCFLCLPLLERYQYLFEAILLLSFFSCFFYSFRILSYSSYLCVLSVCTWNGSVSIFLGQKKNKPTEWNESKNHKKKTVQREKRTEQKTTNFDLNELSLLNRFESANELTNVKTKRSWSWKKESNEKKLTNCYYILLTLCCIAIIYMLMCALSSEQHFYWNR